MYDPCLCQVSRVSLFLSLFLFLRLASLANPTQEPWLRFWWRFARTTENTDSARTNRGHSSPVWSNHPHPPARISGTTAAGLSSEHPRPVLRSGRVAYGWAKPSRPTWSPGPSGGDRNTERRKEEVGGRGGVSVVRSPANAGQKPMGDCGPTGIPRRQPMTSLCSAPRPCHSAQLDHWSHRMGERSASTGERGVAQTRPRPFLSTRLPIGQTAAPRRAGRRGAGRACGRGLRAWPAGGGAAALSQ